jgi:hypothetical protein
VYTVFAPYSPSFTIFLLLAPLPLVSTPLALGRTCSALLFSDFVKEKKIFLLV